MDAPPPDVAIVGAGVAGLSCALALADAGFGVEVCERDDRLGGRASSWRDATTGDVVDIGPHVLTSEHVNFVARLRRLGTSNRVRWQPEPLITLYDHGRVLRIPSRPLPAPLQGLPVLPQALRCVSWRDLWSNAPLVAAALRLGEDDTAALDREDAWSYLRRHGVSARFIDWFWTPTCLALLNVPLRRCSAAALMRVFRLMLGRSGYHFGFPTCGLSELFAEPCAAALAAAGSRVRRGRRVRRVLLGDAGCTGVELDGGERVRARCIVLALPPDAIAALALPWQPAWLQRFEPSPYISSVLWFDRRVTGERFWARVWAPGDLNLDFYDLANIRGLPPDAGSIVASNAIHVHEAPPDASVIERTRREIAEFAPAARRARLRHAAVHRIPMAIACPLPGSEALRPDNRTPLRNLWIAGDWTRTALPASMESACRSGLLAAEQVAAALGRRLHLARPAPETTGAVALLRRGWSVVAAA